MLELPLEVEGLDVRFESLRGDRYEFGWTGPLLKNGEEVPLSGYPHIDNPYTATPLNAESMEIQFQDLLLRPALGVAVPTRGYRYSQLGPRPTKLKPCHNTPTVGQCMSLIMRLS